MRVYDKNEQGQKVGQVKCERPIEVLFEWKIQIFMELQMNSQKI